MQAEEGTDWLLELLTELQLQQYFLRIRDELNVTRLSHFEYVKNEDLEKIGMGRPGAYVLPKFPPVPLAGCTASFGEPRRACGPWGWRGPPPRAGLVTVPVSCRPATAVGGSEAEESHVQAEILDEQGRDGRGADVAGKLRQTGPLPTLPVPGGWQVDGQKPLPRMPCLRHDPASVCPGPAWAPGSLPGKGRPCRPCTWEIHSLHVICLFARKLVCS